VNTSSFFFGVALWSSNLHYSNLRVKYAGQYLIFYRGDTQAKFLRYALNVPLANAEDVPRFEQVHFQFSKQLLLRSPVLNNNNHNE